MYNQSQQHGGGSSGAGRASRREMAAVNKASVRNAGLSPGRTRRRTSSNHRSHSPHHYMMDGQQSSAYLTSEVTHHQSRSPYQSPAHSRSSSMTSVKSLLRDRSLERDWDVHGLHSSDRRAPLVRDRSLDRQLDGRQNRVGEHRTSEHRPASARDRSLDRAEYGSRTLDRVDYMTQQHNTAARSLERDGAYGLSPRRLTRSRSIDHEFLMNQQSYAPATDMRHARDGLLLDMQSSVNDLNRECLGLTQELDMMREKLSTSMNSIKTFWSPELKKERVMRKEESAKYTMLLQQLHQSQQQLKVLKQVSI